MVRRPPSTDLFKYLGCMDVRLDPRSVGVATACSYEVVALTTGKVPTLTSMAWKARRSWWGRAAIWVALGYLSWHLLVEEDMVGQIVGDSQ